MSQQVSYKCKCGSVRVVQSPPVQSEPMQGKRYLGGEPDLGMWLACEGRCNTRNVSLDASEGWVRLGKRPWVHTWHELVKQPSQLEREQARVERKEMHREVREHSEELFRGHDHKRVGV